MRVQLNLYTIISPVVMLVMMSEDRGRINPHSLIPPDNIPGEKRELMSCNHPTEVLDLFNIVQSPYSTFGRVP